MPPQKTEYTTEQQTCSGEILFVSLGIWWSETELWDQDWDLPRSQTSQESQLCLSKDVLKDKIQPSKC